MQGQAPGMPPAPVAPPQPPPGAAPMAPAPGAPGGPPAEPPNELRMVANKPEVKVEIERILGLEAIDEGRKVQLIAQIIKDSAAGKDVKGLADKLAGQQQ